MRERCLVPTHKDYAGWGGRGVTVCERWAGSFEAFFADMGERPSGTTLDRYPNRDGNYEPGNCRWATAKQQQTNRRNTRLFTIDGVTRCMSDWAALHGIGNTTVHYRLSKGMSIEEALA
jgi:hypothetical protein